MTVAGMWSLLKNKKLVHNAEGANARDILEGKRIAIDMSMWIVQGTVMELTCDTRHRHFLSTGFWRLCRYKRIGVFPLGVLEGLCPKSKRRRRCDEGDFHANLKLLSELFHMMGCPTVQADGEAESCCSQLSQHDIVDAIESSDSDVFPFGAKGCILKSIEYKGIWKIEYVNTSEVQMILGFGQKGMISLALLSGCDFAPRGLKNCGIEKALTCIKTILQFTPEERIQDFF